MLQQQHSLRQLAAIAARFDAAGHVTDGGPHGTGHIHDTYRLRLEHNGTQRHVVLQRMNHDIFKNIEKLMENICRVTEHIRGRLRVQNGFDPDRECLRVIPTREGASFVRTPGGESWRMYQDIVRARTHDRLSHPRQAYEAARAFGRFQTLLSDLPPPPLHETIARFHDTPKRFADLRASIEADPVERAADCRADIDFALAQKAITPTLINALADGSVPMRVTHNDTKLNNVMMDETTGEGICVVDLDTVMPGSTLFDFGDMVRSMVGNFDENEPDQSKVAVDLERYDQLVEGYLSVAHEFMTAREAALLTLSGALITFEIGIRFLKDYLDGDVYFKISHPHENLDRARTQFALVRSIQRHRAAMEDVVARHWR